MSAARRITGAEARELAAKATPGAWSTGDDCSVCAGRELVANAYREPDARLLAAAPDLAESLAAAEAERDALRAKIVAYGQAHDARTAHSKRADSGAELWFAERDELNNAVSDALAALREAAK